MLVVVTQLALQYLTVYAVMGGAIVGRVWKKLTMGAVSLLGSAAVTACCCVALAVMFVGLGPTKEAHDRELPPTWARICVALCVLAVVGELLGVLALPRAHGGLQTASTGVPHGDGTGSAASAGGPWRAARDLGGALPRGTPPRFRGVVACCS